MPQEEHKLSTVAEEKAALGAPQTKTVDQKAIKLKKPKSKKKKLRIIIGEAEEVRPGETHVQEQTIKLGGKSKRGGKMGATIGRREFKYKRLSPSITSSGRLIRRHGGRK